MNEEDLFWWENLCELRQRIGATQGMTQDNFKTIAKDKFYLVNYWKDQQKQW